MKRMTNMNQIFRQGDVWIEKVYFKNEEQYKHRPVIIVGQDITIDIDVIISPVTSSKPRNVFDVMIHYWKDAGLRHPSVARTTKLHAIPQSSFAKKLGSLHDHDLHRILQKCKELF